MKMWWGKGRVKPGIAPPRLCWGSQDNGQCRQHGHKGAEGGAQYQASPLPPLCKPIQRVRGDAWHLSLPFPFPRPHFRHCSLSCDLHGNEQGAFPTSSTKPKQILWLHEVPTVWCVMVGKDISDGRHCSSPLYVRLGRAMSSINPPPFILVKTNANGGRAMSNITLSLPHLFSFETFK